MSEPQRVDAAGYRRELRRLQAELVKLQYWIRSQGLRVVVVFEGRDAAGKGGVIRRITRHTSPRVVRVAALPKPTERERGQWYFQRYVAHLPRAGEMVLFDRSWYNRAGVEPVMGLCSEAEAQEFLVSCPQFERMLVRSGIRLVKYWFALSYAEQGRRLQARVDDPLKRWKLSPIDVQAQVRWADYTRAQERMFRHCHTPDAPWHVVDGDCKEAARLNCMRHLLAQFEYKDMLPPQTALQEPPPPDEAPAAGMPPPLPPAYVFEG